MSYASWNLESREDPHSALCNPQAHGQWGYIGATHGTTQGTVLTADGRGPGLSSAPQVHKGIACLPPSPTPVWPVCQMLPALAKFLCFSSPQFPQCKMSFFDPSKVLKFLVTRWHRQSKGLVLVWVSLPFLLVLGPMKSLSPLSGLQHSASWDQVLEVLLCESLSHLPMHYLCGPGEGSRAPTEPKHLAGGRKVVPASWGTCQEPS